MRTGLIAKKVGMSRVFKADGSNIPVTLLKVDNCKVIEHKILEKNGYSALRISYGVSKKTKINLKIINAAMPEIIFLAILESKCL